MLRRDAVRDLVSFVYMHSFVRSRVLIVLVGRPSMVYIWPDVGNASVSLSLSHRTTLLSLYLFLTAPLARCILRADPAVKFTVPIGI